MLRYGTFCSGIEAPAVAWHCLGWRHQWFSEIEPFPCAVLQHHYPDVRNLGDMLEINGDGLRGTVELICAGTPCQSFSVAGKRGGMADPRGQLAIRFIELLERIRPRWLVWENVPGVLSSNGGRDFGALLWALGQCGYGFAYRVLDAQHWGVPQRRRRVFVVGHSSGEWRRAAAVLFERESLRRDIAPRKATGKEVAGTLGGGTGICGWRCDTDRMTFVPRVSMCLNAKQTRIDGETEGFVAELAPTLKGFGAGSGRAELTDGNGDGMVAFGWNKSAAQTMRVDDTTDALQASPPSNPAVLVPTAIGIAGNLVGRKDANGPNGIGVSGDSMFTLNATDRHAVQHGAAVRRLTPTECERLQGFPDDYTLIPWRGKPAEQCPDGPRYRALGNSMAVPVVRWIGQRIEMVERIMEASR